MLAGVQMLKDADSRMKALQPKPPSTSSYSLFSLDIQRSANAVWLGLCSSAAALLGGSPKPCGTSLNSRPGVWGMQSAQLATTTVSAYQHGPAASVAAAAGSMLRTGRRSRGQRMSCA